MRIAGVDEAGRGPLFGPVVAAAVILPKGCRLQGLTDSKKLSAKKAHGAGRGDSRSCGMLGHRRGGRGDHRPHQHSPGVFAGHAATQWSSWRISPDYLLIDGRDTIDWDCEQQAVIRGDGTSFSIAAASVLAKVYRDRLLVELDEVYPGYGLARHKGYGSREHMAALDRLGPTPLHRMSYGPVAQAMLRFE